MEPFLSLTIARQNSDMRVQTTKRRFAVQAEMSSATRPKRKPAPKIGRSTSSSSNRSVELDLEVVMQRGPIYNFIVRYLPITLGIFCAIGAVASCYADMNTRWSYSTQAKFASYARAHSEPFRASQMPTIFKIVDTFIGYRNVQDMKAPQGDGVIVNNMTPGAAFASSTEESAKKENFELLAIGSARVAAEAIRSEDARTWNLYVPRTISELVDYAGGSFVDGIVLAGDQHAFFPAAKSYSFLHDGGLLVQHLPPHVNGRSIFASYQRVFGADNVRSESIHAGSRMIICEKREFNPKSTVDPLPYEKDNVFDEKDNAYGESLEKQYMDYHYLTM